MAALVTTSQGPGSAQGAASFHRDVRPILQRRCAGCHQPAIRSGKLSLVTFAAAKSGGIAGAGFVSGKPADSPIFKSISGKNPTMPKGGPPLTAREVETIRLWIAQGGRDDTPAAVDTISQERPPVYVRPPVVAALAYSPDGALLALAGYREVILRKSDGVEIVGRLVGRSQRIESIAFSPDGKTLAAVGGTSCRFGELQLWDVAERKLVKSVEIGFDVLYGVSFSPDGKQVCFGGAEKSVYVYTVPDGKQVLKFDNHSDWVFGTTFTTDSKHFVSVSRDRSLKLVEITQNSFVDDINYQVYGGGYSSVSRNPKSDEVAVGGEEGIIRIYSIYKKAARNMMRDDFNLIRTFDKLSGPISAVAYSPDGSMVAAGGQSPEVLVFKAADGSRVATLKGHTGTVHTLAWNEKSGELAVSGFDGSVRVYSLPDGKQMRQFVAVPMAARVTRSP